MTDVPYPYPRLHFSEAERCLAWLAGLPLVDGVFASAMASGSLQGVTLIVLGLTVFSGAGCLAAALSLQGSAIRRAMAVARIYLLLVLPGALLESALLPLVRALLFPGFGAFAALVLVGVAASLAGCRFAPSGPLPQVPARRWHFTLRLLFVPEVVLAVGLGVSLLHLLLVLAHGALQLTTATPIPWDAGAAAVLIGMAESLLGALVGAALHSWFSPRWVGRGGALALLGVAGIVLGVPLPPVLPLLALAAGIGAGLLHRSARPARGHTPVRAGPGSGGCDPTPASRAG